MDPITHTLAGAVVASFSGRELSISEPIYLGAMLGSVAPDLDIVFQLKGDMCYLKYHRGFSHSIFGLGIFAFLITGLLLLFYPQAEFSTLFLWTFVGGLSHTVLDVLNSYGAKALWPFNNKKLNIGILTIFDPVLVLIMLSTIVGRFYSHLSTWFGTSALIMYLVFRYLIAIKIRKILINRYGDKIIKVNVLPSMVSIWNWHFLVECNNKLIVGEMKFFSWKLKVKKIFRKQRNHPVVKAALDSRLGKMFKEFTPIFHVFCKRKKYGHEVKFVDLRYLFKDEFIHSATGFFNKQQQLIKGLFHPYSQQKNIKVVDFSGS
ncbi:MAG: rane-bound metal-dependent hydrolase [Clostridiales bacterium]|jgi:inner membrane protein|nr:rane-bound metal-dependent hydrolase [Clostridiales bacterium]